VAGSGHWWPKAGREDSARQEAQVRNTGCYISLLRHAARLTVKVRRTWLQARVTCAACGPRGYRGHARCARRSLM